jgi:hypothetical protein
VIKLQKNREKNPKSQNSQKKVTKPKKEES